MNKTMKILNVAAISTLVTTTAIIAVVPSIKSEINKDGINGMNANAQTATKIAKEKADFAIAHVSEAQVNNAIKNKKPFTNKTDLSRWVMPGSVVVHDVNDGHGGTIDVTVAITFGVKDLAHGLYPWTGVTSAPRTNNKGAVKGKLGKFLTSGQKALNADAGLAKVTKQMIDDAILVKAPFNTNETFAGWKMPPSVEVDVNGDGSVIVKVALTPGTPDAINGSYPWNAILTADGTKTNKALSGNLDGFETIAARNERLAKVAIGNVTEQMVNDAIKAKKPFTNKTDLSIWKMPNSVVLNVSDGTATGKVNVTVVLTPGTKNLTDGKYPWTAVTSANAITGSVKGTASTFETAAEKATRIAKLNTAKADYAMNHITVKQINDALKILAPVNSTMSVTNFKHPDHIVVKNVDDGHGGTLGVNVMLIPAFQDKVKGEFNWIGIISVPHASHAHASINGALPGFKKETTPAPYVIK